MATITIDVNELPSRLAEAAARAAGGDEVIVSGGGGVAVKLVPLPPAPRREWVFNLHPGAMTMRADFNDYMDEDAFLRGDP